MANIVTVSKIAGGLLVGGGMIGGGVAYAMTSNSPVTTIKEKIAKANRTILRTSDSGWDIKLHAYNALTSKIELTDKTENGLKTWCTEVLDKPSNTEEGKIQEQAIKVCTVPTSKEKLLKEKKVLAIEGDWQGRATEYTEKGKDALAIPEFNGKTNPTKEEIKNWCSTALDVEIKDGKGNYDLTLKWCTKTGA